MEYNFTVEQPVAYRMVKNALNIVSKNRKNSRGKIKVGLLPLAWFEWWPMFPESGMRENILSDCDRFISIMKEKFASEYDLVYPDYYVDTLDKAFDVGELFKKEGVDMVIIDEATLKSIEPDEHNYDTKIYKEIATS